MNITTISRLRRSSTAGGTPSLLILFALGSFAFVQLAQAVSPPPDGGYPGGNTAEGQSALLSLTTGVYNTAIGLYSLESNGTENFNTAIGAGTLLLNTADQNTAVGAGALLSNTTGADNTANGAFALFSNTEGILNTAVGNKALLNNADGGANTAIGSAALSNNMSSSFNTAIGINALGNNSSGSENIGLGDSAGFNVTTASNVICIGSIGQNTDNSCFIGNTYSNVQPVIGIDPDYVTITSDGRLGRGNNNGSSRRFKHDIQPMDKASEAILALKPVSFRYNKEYDATQRPFFGLIAEEVAEVAPDLVGRNKNGEPDSVRYEQINTMLLNEFLKEHRKVEQLEATVVQQRNDFETTIAQLKKEMESIIARSKEQDAKIQGVSGRVELKSPATNVVLDNR